MIKFIQLSLLLLITGHIFVLPLSAQDTTGSIRTERLKWLEFDWDCDGFQDQIKARYSSFGAYDEMPEQIRGDLDIVLEVACSKRFAHCSFKNCQTSNILTPEVREKLLKERKELVKKKFQKRKELVTAASREEKKLRASWKRFEVPGDRVIKARGTPDEAKKTNTRAKAGTKKSTWKRRSRRRRAANVD